MKIGDKVKLNDHGLLVAFGNPLGLSYMKTKIYTIVNTQEIPLDDADDQLIIVDDPEISQLMLYTSCFDKVN